MTKFANKKYGIIAVVIIAVLAVLLILHKLNQPSSPIVGNWGGREIDMNGTDDGSAWGIKHKNDEVTLQAKDNHTFILKVNDNSAIAGSYSGKWAKTSDVNDDGDKIYVLKLDRSSNSDGLDKDEKNEYFALRGKNNILQFGPSDNQNLNARLHKLN